MSDYSNMKQEDFDRLLLAILRDTPASSLLAVAGVYEVVAEHFNNDVLALWDQEQAEKKEG